MLSTAQRRDGWDHAGKLRLSAMAGTAAAGERAHHAYLRRLSSDRALLPARLVRRCRGGPQILDVPVANLDRHRHSSRRVSRPLRKRAMVDLYQALAAPDALGMGAA